MGGGEGGGYKDWRGTAPKVPAGIRRERERDIGEVGDRLVDRQTGRSPQSLRLDLKRGLGGRIVLLIASTDEESERQICL